MSGKYNENTDFYEDGLMFVCRVEMCKKTLTEIGYIIEKVKVHTRLHFFDQGSVKEFPVKLRKPKAGTSSRCSAFVIF